jgi:xylan 1,4-beta-xylosidase
MRAWAPVVVALAIAVTCCVAVTMAVSQPVSSSQYINPVIPGDHADPSIIRVGDVYWATSTTAQWAPIFPLMTSRDLVTWTEVGAVFTKPPEWSAGSYWAPEIAEHGGRFYVYYTARKKNGPLCVAVATATSPGGPYTDRGPLVCQDLGSIDAAPVTDEHGTRYLVWKEDGNSVKQTTRLWAQPMSADGTSMTGEPREILHDEASWEGHLIEAPYLLRRGEWFYLFYSADACCGRRCNYKLGVARSKSVLGPWERARTNPILAGNETWKCPGHGSLVTEPSGRTFLLYHAYAPRDYMYIGRESMLDEVMWNADGWPTINGGKGPSRMGTSPIATTSPATGTVVGWPFADEFTTRELLPGWQWLWDREPKWQIEPARVGWLVLRASGADDTMMGALLARQMLAGEYVATTRVDMGGLPFSVRAGLLAYGDDDHAAGISATRDQVAVWIREKGKERPVAVDAVPGGNALYLRVTARNAVRFQFAMSADGQRWQSLGPEVDGTYLPSDRAIRIALTAAGPEGTHARFDWLRIDPAADGQAPDRKR